MLGFGGMGLQHQPTHHVVPLIFPKGIEPILCISCSLSRVSPPCNLSRVIPPSQLTCRRWGPLAAVTFPGLYLPLSILVLVTPTQRTVPNQTRLELFVRGILTEYNTIYLGNIIYLGSQKEWLTGLRGLKRYTAFRGGLSRAPRPRPPRARPYHPFGLNGR